MQRVIGSPLGDIAVPSGPLAPYVLRKADELADHPALIEGATARTLTYGELRDRVRRFAGGLRSRGFRKGHVFAILAPNVPEYAIAFHAVALLGGVVTTINPTYTSGEAEHQLRDSGARFLLTIDPLLEMARSASAETSVEEILVHGQADGATPMSAAYGERFTGEVSIDPSEDVVVMPYSSGTTGLPKGVMLTHRNLVANLRQCDLLQPTPGEAIVAALPFFHIYGMQVLLNWGLASGATVITMPRFDLRQFLQHIERHRAQRVFVVPPIALALARDPIVDEHDLSSLRHVFSAAAPLGADLEAEVSNRLGCRVHQGYGMTEASPATHMPLPGGCPSGSVGVLTAGTECRIVDPESGEDLGVGQDGEIWVRGPQIMKGYLNNPRATRDTVDAEGWLHTGDIGHVDEQGHFYIVDRLKELIKFKGFQVAPAELEAILLAHPAVADAAVVPFPDEEAGEIPKAFVVRTAGAVATPEELMAFVADRVAHFKQIRRVELVDGIPKSPSGKILRRLLRDRDRSAG